MKKITNKLFVHICCQVHTVINQDVKQRIVEPLDHLAMHRLREIGLHDVTDILSIPFVWGVIPRLFLVAFRVL